VKDKDIAVTALCPGATATELADVAHTAQAPLCSGTVMGSRAVASYRLSSAEIWSRRGGRGPAQQHPHFCSRFSLGDAARFHLDNIIGKMNVATT
jgi:short-subunit dehydrogenase